MSTAVRHFLLALFQHLEVNSKHVELVQSLDISLSRCFIVCVVVMRLRSYLASCEGLPLHSVMAVTVYS